MPKKPPRHSSGQHRPQPKRKDVLLVRANSATEVVEDVEEEETEEQGTTEKSKASAPRAKPASTPPKAATHPTAPAVKRPGVPAKPAQSTRPLSAAQRSGRPGQRPAGRPGQRLAVGRQANLVSAEHYRYVLKDLRLIGILAAVMFSAIIALTFILPHVLKY